MTHGQPKSLDGGAWAFSFQAEDGIRDDLVTGVQTCALPICQDLEQGGFAGPVLAQQRVHRACAQAEGHAFERLHGAEGFGQLPGLQQWGQSLVAWTRVWEPPCRSEERRVGKECRSRWSPYH